MDALEISYLLKRARAHRFLGHAAKCSEARSVHHRFVKRYQELLLAIRRARLSPRIHFKTLNQRQLGPLDKVAAMATEAGMA